MQAPPPKPPGQLRLVTYNIRKAVGLDRRRDPHRIAGILQGLQADLIALQEADRRLPPRRAALPPHVIAKEAGLQVAPVAKTAVSLGWHGNALLMGPGWQVTEIDHLPLPGLEPRGAVISDLTGAWGAVRLVSTHLGLRRRDRQRQMTAIMAALAARPARETVLMGDLNEWSPAAGFAPLDPFFTLHNPGRSFPAWRPMAALDRVATGPGVRLVSAGVLRQGPAARASDHLPVWADVARDG